MSVTDTVSLGPPKSSTRLASNSPVNQMVSMHNPIQLTAISNYKLAQLTFATPDLHSMRKTALVKNMLEMLYKDTPPEWLDQMTRWVFFTPESLGDMTQEHLEEIFAQYAHTIEAFQPLSLDDDEDEDEDKADMWADIDDDHLVHHQDNNHILPKTPFVSEPSSPTYDIVSINNDILPLNLPPSPVSLVEKSLPNSPKQPFDERHQDQHFKHTAAAVGATTTTTTTTSSKRKSLTSGLRSKNRLSWTSDTGVSPSSVIVQHMTSQMMTLFDMDFSVDIEMDNAPQLPELPFGNKDDTVKHRRSAQRFSNDSFTGLINKFETYTVEDEQHLGSYNVQATTPKRRSRLSRQMTFPPPPVEFPSGHVITKRRSASLSSATAFSSPPARSSSLKYRNQQSLTVSENPKTRTKSKSTEFLSTLAHALGGGSSHQQHDTATGEPKEPDQDHHKGRSVLRIASSLVKGNSRKHKKSTAAATTTLNLDNVSTATETVFTLTVPQAPSDEHRKSISSIVSSSSSWSSTSEVLIARKASLRRKPTITSSDHNNSVAAGDVNDEQNSFTALQPVVFEAYDLRRARSLGHNRYPTSKRKKNRRSSLLMEKTASKHKSNQRQPIPENPEGTPPVVDNSSNKNTSHRKSTFIRIGRSSNKQEQQQQQQQQKEEPVTDARRRSTSPSLPQTPPPSNNDDVTEPVEKSFVKRMATLGRRMRLQRA